MGRNYRQQDMRGQPGRGNSVCEGVELCLGESQYWKRGAQGKWQKPSVDSLRALLVHPKSFEASAGEQEYPPLPHKLWIRKE